MFSVFMQYERPAKIFSLGSDYFSATFYQIYFITKSLKHIFVTFLPSREKQINSLLWCLLETLINSAAKRTSRRILISRKHFRKPWKYKEVTGTPVK